jgi:hypothetical protein
MFVFSEGPPLAPNGHRAEFINTKDISGMVDLAGRGSIHDHIARLGRRGDESVVVAPQEIVDANCIRQVPGWNMSSAAAKNKSVTVVPARGRT